jgi:MmgE/PrpD N-terminal domain
VEGTPIFSGQICVMQQAPHPNAARLFANYLFSGECQQMLTDSGDLRSFHSGVRAKPAFEGGPVHSGAVIVPAMMALCEREGLDGAALLRGIVVGTEIQCRLGLVAPKAIYKAGFHPTAVLGTLAVAGAAAGRHCGCLWTRRYRASALPAARPPASSNIWRRAPGRSACMRAGRHRPACVRR